MHELLAKPATKVDPEDQRPSRGLLPISFDSESSQSSHTFIASPATNSKSSHISITSPVTNFEEYPYFHYIARHKLASNGHHHGSSMEEENNTKREGLQGVTYKLLAG
jgi:hypothetical protein